MERQKFEDSWKESFKDAEVSPSDNLWTNIELDLEKENGSKMKRRIMFFQLLAAASIAFAMTFAGVGVYFMLDNYDTQTQLATDVIPAESTTPAAPDQSLTGSNNNNDTATTDQAVSGTAHTGTGSPDASRAPVQPQSSTEVAATGNDPAAAFAPGRPVASRQNAPAADRNTPPMSNQIVRATDQPASTGTPDRTTSGSNRASTGADQSTLASNNVARTSDQVASASEPDASAPDRATATSKRVASAPGQVMPASSHVASTADYTAPASNHVASDSYQHTPASASDISGRPTRNTAFAARDNNTKHKTPVAGQQPDQSSQIQPAASNPFTSIVATAPPTERNLSTTRGPLPLIAHPAEPSLATAVNEPDPVALMLARLDDQEKQYAQGEKEKKKKDKGTERLWTSVGFSAGAYNMVTSGGGAAAASSFDPQSYALTSNSALTSAIVREQSSASGTAYSAGLNVGTKLATRWVLQGGVNYLTQSSNYTTTAAVGTADNSFKAASINELDKISNSGRQNARVISTAPYRVNSSLQYFSVPLQAGYLVVNRAFGLQFNAGVSTDLFVKNTLTPDGGSLEKTTQTRSDDTPYRPINFSGLVGTEFSYRFGQHYRLALNPGLRYPFSSIYKSDISVSAMPLTFDVGLKFRYIFH